MPAFLKPFLLSILAAALLAVSGCGYTWRGEENSSTTHSVLGDGSKTLRIRSVEQTTLYAWIPYIVRSQLRDEIAARGLAKWVDAAPSDFTIGVKILGCRMRSDNDLSSGMPNLVTATISMVFSICNVSSEDLLSTTHTSPSMPCSAFSTLCRHSSSSWLTL